ncbi:peptidoglycan DD-metalloendopeptidase family protein [Rhodococcus erythropolis]|uniref:peptidoglycan DD-metalloendopeptidase family protein n=1 Tax=Rhodococcus erythropolis TaxID=1833 RepID=UPI00366D9C14
MSKHRKRKPSNPSRFIAASAGISALVGAGTVGGTGIAGAQDSPASCSWEWPVGGSLSQGYHAGHDGVDFAVDVGTVLHAPASGTISVSGPNDPGGYGTYIQLEADTGEQVQMGHLSETWVGVGDRVEVGDEIGATGNTGSSTGPHLHLRIHSGESVDPMVFLSSVGACGTDSSLVAAPEAPPETAPESTPPPASAMELGVFNSVLEETISKSHAPGKALIVETGDTLFDLGSEWGIPWRQIWDMNPQIVNPNQIFVGDTINL